MSDVGYIGVSIIPMWRWYILPTSVRSFCSLLVTASTLQEGIYSYVGKDGSKFNFTLFLLLLECTANVLVGLAGYLVTGGTKGLPQDMFALTGGTQIAAKFLTNAAMATGVSFPTQFDELRYQVGVLSK
eukprot:9347291-Pyramimonas_sp.AAC.1